MQYWRIVRGLTVATALSLPLSLCAVASVTAPASASASGPAAHTRTGPVINTLVVGDSYTAGNGAAGPTYDVSPDDPHTPPAPYSGSGCWRKYNNASMQAYNSLASTGTYINRACSSKRTTDVLPEVADLVGTSTGNAVDLVVYSAGGNDVHFGDIAEHCILAGGGDLSHITIGGRSISANCYNLLAALKSQIGDVIANEQANLVALLSEFPNAHIVIDGYPMLVNKVGSLGSIDVQDNTINYAYAQLAAMMPQIMQRQSAMVGQLSSRNSGRLAFNDVFTRFGGVAGNHGVHSSSPWLYGVRPNIMESLHPNPTGQSQIAAGIAATVRAAGWFASFPQAVGQAVDTFNFMPRSPTPGGVYQLMDNAGAAYTTTTAASSLASCWQQTLTISGWVGSARHVLELSSAGPDTIRVRCVFPQTGDIVSFGSAAYLASGSGPGYTLASIPTGWMFNCLAGASGVHRYTITQGSLALKGAAGTAPGQASCVPAAWRNHVLVGPNGASYFVDGGGVRHWVQSTQTFYTLTQTYGAAIRLGVQVDVNTIPEGAWQPEQLYAPTHENTIIRRADGVSWIVDANGWRHHIPAYADDVCSRWLWGYPVSETGLSYDLANSLPEATAWSCSGYTYIVATNEGAAYLITGDVRHWIQDPESFWAYAARGYSVVRGISMAEVQPIPEGGWMQRIVRPNHVFRAPDGTAYFVDGGGTWHWIPNGGTWYCLVPKYPVVQMSWADINAVKHEGSWAACGM